jgi:hypothetical protein
LIDDVVTDLRASGEDVPEPLAERRFSGEFVTRVPSDLHRLLAIEAAEAGVSLNRLVSAKLAMPLSAGRAIRRGTAERGKSVAARWRMLPAGPSGRAPGRCRRLSNVLTSLS